MNLCLHSCLHSHYHLPLLPTSGHDHCSGHDGMEKQPIRGLSGFSEECVIFVLPCVSSRDFISLSYYNDRHMGSDFTCFGVTGGVPRGHESSGRYHLSLCY